MEVNINTRGRNINILLLSHTPRHTLVPVFVVTNISFC